MDEQEALVSKWELHQERGPQLKCFAAQKSLVIDQKKKKKESDTFGYAFQTLSKHTMSYTACV